MQKHLKRFFSIGVLFMLLVGLGSSSIAADGDLTLEQVDITMGVNSQADRTTVLYRYNTDFPSATERKKFPFQNTVLVYKNVGFDTSKGYGKNGVIVEESGKATGGYSSIDAGVTHIAFDVLYGYYKAPLIYKGEVPKQLANAETNEEDKTSNVFRRLRYTTYTDCNGNIGNDFCILWSKDAKAMADKGVDGSDAVTQFQQLTSLANKENDVRLSASLHTNHDGDSLFAISSLLYFPIKISMTVLHYLFELKGIEISDILMSLNGTNLSSVMNALFLGDGNTVSPYLIMCIVGFIFAIVGSAWKYYKGNGAVDKLRETLIVGFIGLIIIGVSLTTKAYTIVEPVSTLVTEAIESIDVAYDESIALFQTKTSSVAAKPKAQNLNQESLIHKMYIDLAIQNQFGSDMEDLVIGGQYIDSCTLFNFDQNGSARVIGSADRKKLFADNLGYYYWYANSGASQLVSSDLQGFSDSSTQTRKIESMLNCLQQNLDNAPANSAKKQQLLGMIQNLANPNTMSMLGVNIMFTAECVLLILMLARFIFPILEAKIEILASTFGLPVAGPLLLLNNKKTTSFARSIISLFIVGLLKLCIYSLVVMLIIYIVSFAFKPNSNSMLITLMISFLGNKFAPVLKREIRKFIDNTERKIAPELGNMRRASKKFFGDKASDLSESRFGSTIDKNTGEVRANMLGRIMGNVSDSLEAADERQRKSRIKQRQQKRDKLGDRGATNAKNLYDNLAKEIENHNNAKKEGIKQLAKDLFGNKDYNEKGDTNQLQDLSLLDMNKLNNNEKQLVLDYQNNEKDKRNIERDNILINDELANVNGSLTALNMRLAKYANIPDRFRPEDKDTMDKETIQKVHEKQALLENKQDLEEKANELKERKENNLNRLTEIDDKNRETKRKLMSSMEDRLNNKIDETYGEQEEYLRDKYNKLNNRVAKGDFEDWAVGKSDKDENLKSSQQTVREKLDKAQSRKFLDKPEATAATVNVDNKNEQFNEKKDTSSNNGVDLNGNNSSVEVKQNGSGSEGYKPQQGNGVDTNSDFVNVEYPAKEPASDVKNDSVVIENKTDSTKQKYQKFEEKQKQSEVKSEQFKQEERKAVINPQGSVLTNTKESKEENYSQKTETKSRVIDNRENYVDVDLSIFRMTDDEDDVSNNVGEGEKTESGNGEDIKNGVPGKRNSGGKTN